MVTVRDIRNAVEAARAKWANQTGTIARRFFAIAENLSARADEFAARTP